ncbi:lycopene cyclase domain-containing protein [Marinilabiliaceae bacterium JC017]|nr:lycopene cyclase domain-containing protein [Marinilabiliaceae bacterium JC017]
MSLYSLLLIFSISIPLALSFDKKLQFYKQWKTVLPSLFVVGSGYILCDVNLTNWGVWGFNPTYHSAIVFFNLPLEEWLFFILIPYACLFIHYSFILYFPKLQLASPVSLALSIVILSLLLIILITNIQKTYTVYICSMVILGLIWSFFDSSNTLNSYYVTFLLMLIPFIIVNGILTGSFITEEAVWYNNEEILGIRLLTIPIEDFAYAFSLVLFNLLLNTQLKKVNQQ